MPSDDPLCGESLPYGRYLESTDAISATIQVTYLFADSASIAKLRGGIHIACLHAEEIREFPSLLG